MVLRPQFLVTLKLNADVPKMCPDLSSCDISKADNANEFRQGCVRVAGGAGRKVYEGYRISICQDTIGDLKEVLPLLPISADMNMTTIDEIIDVLESPEEIEITAGTVSCLS